MKKVILDNLPHKNGIGKNANTMVVDWKNSIGYTIPFVYDDIKGEFYIKNFNNKTRIVTIEYENTQFDISNNQLISHKIGKIVGKFTNEFKVKDNLFKDEKRDLKILDKLYKNNIKMYKYHCNKCDNEDLIRETDLFKGSGCNVCSNRKIELGINTIWDTDRWMCDLGISEEDAKTHTKCSGDKVIVTCPNCGKQKQIVINKVYNRKTISCTCGDGISYPEKFVTSILDQLGIKYIREYHPKWSNSKRYDFYLEDYNCIIECHGGQHYTNNTFAYCNGRTLQEEQENDKYKKELALENNIDNYIILDCSKSDIEYIKNSILNSELNKLLDLSNIDWFKCEKFAINSNKVKEISNYWHLHNEINNENLTTTDISKVFNISKNSTISNLKNGSKLGWCNYNPKEERKKQSSKNGELRKKQVEVLKDGKSLGIFTSILQLEKESEKIFGVKLLYNGINRVCRNVSKSYKGFVFRYVK